MHIPLSAPPLQIRVRGRRKGEGEAHPNLGQYKTLVKNEIRESDGAKHA